MAKKAQQYKNLPKRAKKKPWPKANKFAQVKKK